MNFSTVRYILDIFYFCAECIYFTVQYFELCHIFTIQRFKLCHIDRIGIFTTGRHARNLSGHTGINVPYGNITGRRFPRSKQFILLFISLSLFIMCHTCFFYQIRIIREFCQFFFRLLFQRLFLCDFFIERFYLFLKSQCFDLCFRTVPYLIGNRIPAFSADTHRVRLIPYGHTGFIFLSNGTVSDRHRMISVCLRPLSDSGRKISYRLRYISQCQPLFSFSLGVGTDR